MCSSTRADEDYDAVQVEARRITVDTARIASESFPMALPPEEAERRCRRALMETWTGRESATFRLPPSRLALDPADVIRLDHDGRLVELRLISIADAEGRGIEAIRQDRDNYDLPPGAVRPTALAHAVVYGAPLAVLLDLPQLAEDQPAHRPFAAAHAAPWPGEMAVFRSPALDGFALLTTAKGRARVGTLVSDFGPGPTSRFDLGKPLIVRSAYRSPSHNRAVGGAPASKHMLGTAFDIAMSNHDPAAFAEAARATGFLGFGTYPRSGFMHIDLGPARRWGEPFPARATPFLPEIAPAREVLADSRTLKGGGAAGIATVGAAGVEVAQQVLTETQSAILPLVPYLDTLRWVFIAVALIGIAVAIHARIDDWKRGQR